MTQHQAAGAGAGDSVWYIVRGMMDKAGDVTPDVRAVVQAVDTGDDLSKRLAELRGR